MSVRVGSPYSGSLSPVCSVGREVHCFGRQRLLLAAWEVLGGWRAREELVSACPSPSPEVADLALAWPDVGDEVVSLSLLGRRVQSDQFPALAGAGCKQ